jgi:hypothetical protein
MKPKEAELTSHGQARDTEQSYPASSVTFMDVEPAPVSFADEMSWDECYDDVGSAKHDQSKVVQEKVIKKRYPLIADNSEESDSVSSSIENRPLGSTAISKTEHRLHVQFQKLNAVCYISS